MALSSSVINKFVEVTQNPETSTGYYSYGTAIVNGDDKYVQLDGAESVTSISVATDVATGDRVLLYIENHTATVVGNITCPASGRTAISVSQDLLDFETIAVGRLDAVQADIEEVYANYVSTMYLFADYVTANYILAETVAANYATIGDLTALHEYVDSLEASEITTEYLETNYANIASLVAVEEYVTQLAAEMITTDYLQANYATIEDLDATNINVTNLSADYANINSLLAGNAGVGDLQAIYLTADNVVIDSAVMETILASNAIVNDLTAGTIYTSKVRIQTDEGDTSLYLGDSLIQMSEGDLVRLQAGKDATGEYGFYIWNAEGKIMFDATGATSDGIGSEVIVNTHVADDANISGYKLDIASVAERLNADGSLTIEAAQVTINGSTLDAWYAEVTTLTTELGESMTVLETEFDVVQGQITEAVSKTEILEGEVTTISDNYAQIVIDLGAITTEVSSLTTDYNTLTGEYSSLVSEVASITTNVNNITIEVSSLTEDYSGLTSQMSSITTDVSSITSSVSSIESQLSSVVIWNMCSGTSDDWTSYKLSDGENKCTYPLQFDNMNDSNLSVGDVVYVGIDIKFSDDFVASGTGTVNYGRIHGNQNYGGTYTSISITGGNQQSSVESIATGDKIGHVETYFKVTSSMIDGTNSGTWRVGFRFDYVTGTFYYKCAMANVGSSAATWNPSREDIADSVSEESVIEILKNNITLKTSSSTNGTASIILSVDGEDAGDATVVTDARTAFANESSSISLTAGTITLNGGIVTAASGNFTIDKDGNVTMNGAKATNLTITGDSSFYGDIEAKTISLVSDYANFFFNDYIDPFLDGREYYLRIITAEELEEGYWSSTGLYLGQDFVGMYFGANAVDTADEICPGSYNRGTSSMSIDSYGCDIQSAGDLYITAQDRISMEATTNNAILQFENICGSGDTIIRFISFSGKRISVGVGNGGSNRGLYDNESNKWLVYADSSNDFHLGQSSIGSSTQSMYLENGVPNTGFSVDGDVVSITPSAANTPTAKSIKFNTTFGSTPYVVATPQSTVPGTTVLGVGVSSRSKTGCDIYVSRTNTTATSIDYLAIGDLVYG